MTKSSSRKIVVLRDIPSNMIEEAILVLKTDNDQEKKSSYEKTMVEKRKDFLVLKEAEMIIDSYINNRNNINSPKKTVLAEKKWYVDFMINVGLVFGIGVFLFLLLKII